jgi:hypothetical protein
LRERFGALCVTITRRVTLASATCDEPCPLP